jgi:hypothetical protein
MIKNWRSTIGGAFSALGSVLMGCGIVPQLSGNSSHTLTVIATIGFVCNAVGQFLGHLFAADGAALRVVTAQVQENSAAILSGDTTSLRKSELNKGDAGKATISGVLTKS